MKNQMFYSFSTAVVSNHDKDILTKLYLPIIGPKAHSLYLFIVNEVFNKISGKFELRNTINTLLATLNIDENDLNSARQVLEAVGLLKTYLSLSEEVFVFKLIKPLSIDLFFKNKLLKNLLCKKIGEIRVELLANSSKPKQINLDEYQDISIRFNDLFDIDSFSSSQFSQTEIIPHFNSLHDAIESLSSIKFIKYLTNNYPSQMQIGELDNLINLGFSNSSLNLIINYSFVKNGSIIFNFIKTIANDFLKRSINTFQEVKIELENALIANDNKANLNIETSENNKNLDQIFKELLSN